MKKIIYVLILLLITNLSFAASGSSGSSDNKDKGGSGLTSVYKQGKNFVLKAKKIEKKGNFEEALKLYSKGYDKLLEAYAKDKENPDLLNYLGFSLRKKGNFEEAEKFYLAGLKIKPKHKGINEYLGELYLETNRIELAKERLEVLKTCKCKEYRELKELIEKN